MSTDDAPSRKPASKPVGVPRRFAVGTLMVIVAMYSVLFAFLSSLGAHPVVFAVVAVFFTGVGVGQVVLFRGKRPRDASIVCGILLCPAILLTGILVAFFFPPSGSNGGDVGIEVIAQVVCTLAYLAIFGAPLGYAAGCVTAGVFFVMDRIKKAREDATSEPDQTRAAASDEVADDGSPSLDERLWLPVRSALVGLWPRQKGRPVREAVNIFIIIGVLVGLAAPFPEWPWWVHLLGAVAVAFFLGFSRGVFFCRWWAVLLLVVLGGAGALGPGSILRGLFLYPGERIAEYVTLFGVVVGGIAIGLLGAAALGWARRRQQGREATKHGRKATGRLGVVTGLLLVLFYGAVSLWLCRVSRQPWQKALALIERLGGTSASATGPGRTVTHVDLSGTFFRDADLELLSAFGNLSSLELEDTPVTDAGLAHVKGADSLAHLSLFHTQITGAGLKHLQGLTSLRVLDLTGTQVTDTGLKHLKELPSLQYLALDDTGVTDAGLEHLQGLRNLQGLHLRRMQVTGAGLRHLKSLPWLSYLILADSPVTDAGLEHLRSMPSLSGLSLDGTQITNKALEHLRKLTGLEWLDLAHCQVTDAGLVHLKGLTSLEVLNLTDCQVTDAGLAHLKGLKNLQSLDLSGTDVTDAGLVHLMGLQNLGHVNVARTEVTEAGEQKLTDALPDCSVSRY